ncbi:MAG TPA: FliH/SctL family protein [Acidobacteriaceae bacterium]|nr:FliH/SctL family protein [Acidobacteriaceae bacterium]
MSSGLISIQALEYREVGRYGNALAAAVPAPELIESEQNPGVSEEEVTRRVQSAREEAKAEAEERIRVERDRAREEAEERLAQRLREFELERSNYLRSVEREVVQLSLAIARKIIQREAEVDPTLLSGLVRIALDRMQCGTAVRVRVAPAEAERWRKLGRNDGSRAQWDVVADEQLQATDCIVETELGTANFSFEAQLRDVEESFAQLLAHRPAA